jgi:hypothetical protein
MSKMGWLRRSMIRRAKEEMAKWESGRLAPISPTPPDLIEL